MFRSGYAKATIIRCIKNLLFTPAQIQRLRGVVLRALDKCDRQEFRAYCRLATAVHSAEFDIQVRERLKSPDAATHRRARYLLEYLDDWRRSN